jgi:hypothetical protein
VPDAEQRGADVLPQRAVARQLQRAGHHLPGRGEHDAAGARDHGPPRADQHAPSRASAGSTRLRRDHAEPSTARARASQARPGRARLGCTTTVIWPLACAVQANWYRGGHLEGQAETLAGHHDRGPNYLRDVVEITQAAARRARPA